MDTKTKLWIAIVALFIIALFLTFKAGITGNVVASAQAAAPVAKSAASNVMVGGC